MAEEGSINDQQAALANARDGFQNMTGSNEAIAQLSVSLLERERELFEEAMMLQLAFTEWVWRNTPVDGGGPRAAFVLSCYAFDLLKCGWDSLIRGFYAVALHSVRSIDQAAVTQIAVTLDADIAGRFWEGRLRDGYAAKALQTAIEAEDREFGEEWGARRLRLRNSSHEFSHPGRTAVFPSVVIGPDRQSARPTVGGLFDEKQCVRFGRVYAELAFQAAVYAGKAFREVLPPDGELKQQNDWLVGWARPLIDGWKQEMGFS